MPFIPRTGDNVRFRPLSVPSINSARIAVASFAIVSSVPSVAYAIDSADDQTPIQTEWICDELGRCTPPVGWGVIRSGLIGWECATNSRYIQDELGACENL